MNILFIVTAFLFLDFSSICCADIVKQLSSKVMGPKSIFVGVTQEKKQQLKKLEQKIEKEKEHNSIFLRDIPNQIKVIEADIDFLKASPSTELATQKQTILKQLQQVMKDTLRMSDDFSSALDELKKELSNYLADFEFEKFKIEHKLKERLYYSFDDLQRVYEKIQDQEQAVSQLGDSEKNAITDRDFRKRNLVGIQKEIKALQEQLKAEVVSGDLVPLATTQQEIREILLLQLRFKEAKKNYFELRLEQIEYEIELFAHKFFVMNSQLNLLKNYIKEIKHSIRVSDTEIARSQESLEVAQEKYFQKKESLQKERETILAEKKGLASKLQEWSKEYDVALDRPTDDWSRDPVQNEEGNIALARVGLLNSRVHHLDRQMQLINAQIVFEDGRFEYQKLQIDAKKTYNAIEGRHFYSEEELTQEKKKFQAAKTDMQASLMLYKEKISVAANVLNSHKKVIDNISSLAEKATENKDIIFNNREKKFQEFLFLISQAQEQEKEYVEMLGKLTGVYSGITTELDGAIRLIDFIVNQLQASTIWYRPAYAITLAGLGNIFTDTTVFFQDVWLYITQFNVKHLIIRFADLFSYPITFFVLLLQLLGFILVGYIFHVYNHSIANIFFNRSQRTKGLLRIVFFFVGVLVRFVGIHAFGIAFASCIGAICFMFPDPYLYILFYLCLIFYFIYLAYSYIQLFMMYNADNGNIVIPADFQQRFKCIFSVLLYATIIIFFFRQAFMLSGHYLHSELPNILLAVHFIIFQLCLIFSITKEQVLSIIPEYTPLWRWIKELVDTYYYLLLCIVITIIVMSNPYVGFGKLVLYILSSIVYTALLVKGLSWLHSLFKNAVSYSFFVIDNGVPKDRFSNARTLFGLLIMGSLLLTTFLGFTIGAKIWGWPINLQDIVVLLKEPLMFQGTPNQITTYSLLQIIIFIVAGFLIAYLLERFIFSRIFDLLFVEAGVQHTVIRISQYIVIFLAIFLGFQNVGLGSVIGYMFTVLALSVGWYIKDPISDFFSYFIILVQRPINIGDYIYIDETIFGVVRKITARSVILRQKNSYFVIVPNTQIVSRAIYNWNYIRSFIAFNDILITVSYKEDPENVRELLLSAVQQHPRVLKNPKPIIRLGDFTDNGYQFLLRGFISSTYTLDMWDIESEIRLAIVKAFRANNINIAVPIRVYSQETAIDYKGSQKAPSSESTRMQ